MIIKRFNSQLTKLLPGLLLCSLAVVYGCSDDDDDDDDPVSTTCTGVELSSERLFLQQITPTSAIVKWRGDATKLCWGTDMAALNKQKTAETTDGEHKEVLLTGLSPDTVYFYSVGGARTGSVHQQFNTAPETGQLPGDGNIHIWMVGDSGTANDNARAVRRGFESYNGSLESVDLFLMLGDNAYLNGSDPQYQTAVFDMYPDVLTKAALWPTIGNHEMGNTGISTSASPDDYVNLQDPDDGVNTMPYLDIFTLPRQGESGGVSSGTEQYYSFDYGNVHIVSLDSQLSARDNVNKDTMKTWLTNDLSNNTSDWTIVIFHHPPYSKGSHDSDSRFNHTIDMDQPMIDMREDFVPVFDSHGVDFVYNGHSHSYERSYYLRGHVGKSDQFTNANADLNAKGNPANGQGDEAYKQVREASGTDDSAVYTVAGSSGQISGGTLDHPAHFVGLNELGSVVIDISVSQFVARFIGTDGEVLDTVTMTR